MGKVSALLEPRRALLRQLGRNAATIPVTLQTVGPQFLLRALLEHRFTGELDARDAWASYALGFVDGQPVNASAIAGPHRADGERAFNAFVGSRGAEGILHARPYEGARTLKLPLEDLLHRAAQLLNDNELKVRERLLVSATQVQVDAALYDLYRKIGPQPYLETARMICEEHLPAREVMSRGDHSPLLVEEVMRDLIRRGVVTLAQ